VVTIADRYETIATAIAASYMNLPLVHIQGGEVTGSIDEKVRHAITKLADYHFVSTQLAAERVRKMGEHQDRIFKTGCPSIDLALRAVEAGDDIPDPIERYGGVGDYVDLNEPYIVVLQHPVTTEYRKSRAHVEETLHAVKESGVSALWLWPNVDAGSDGTSKGIRAFRERYPLPHIHFFKNLPPEVFIRVLHNSNGIVGNSSVAIRECEAIGVPAVNIGSRQSGRERGENVIDVGYDRHQILQAIREIVKREDVHTQHLYGDGTAGEQIADLLSRIELTTEKRLAY
jgi:UDP-hydrolysing UDP-N-acetyl-D-glucosamine 2-epimerase